MEVLRQPWKNSSGDPISKNPSQKRAGGVVQGVIPEFKLQYHKKKKKNEPQNCKGKKQMFFSLLTLNTGHFFGFCFCFVLR
jgi:hypothetical protein